MYSFFIGIDISKKWIDVCLSLDGDKSRMKHRQFSNDRAGFNQMIKWAKTYAKGIATDKWIFCMEHTGVYTNPLCSFLSSQGLHYVLENALQVKRSIGIRRSKSDSADAADIARYVYLQHEQMQLSIPLEPILLKIKHLLGLRRRLKKARTGIRVAAQELKAFSDKAVHDQVVEMSSQTVDHIKDQIKVVRKDIREAIKSNPELHRLYKLVTSVIGVNLIIGTHLLVYTNAFRSFTDARKFACYIGLAPFGQTSGTSIHVPDKVSHLANKRLKALISNGAMSAIMHDPQLKAYYNRKLKEGKNLYLVQNNVKNKLVQRIFAVVKRGTDYVKLGNH